MLEPDGQEDSTPAAQEEPPLLPEVWEFSTKEGYETSVFATLAKESEGSAAEAEVSSCNLERIALPAPHIVRLPNLPTVTYRVSPTGETTCCVQWNPK